MTTISKNARIVGFIYLLLVFCGPLRLMYIPNKLFVDGDAATSGANIAAHQTLFQLGIFADAWGGVILVFLALAFYRLFKDVDQYWSVVLVIVGGILPSAIYFLNTVNDAAALLMVRGAPYLDVFSEPQRYALAYFFTRLHFQVILAAEVLWGLWLFPMAILILKSRWFPRFLGYWLILNGLSYLVLSYVGMFAIDKLDTLSTYAFPLQFGEVAFVLWALIMGAKERPASGRAATGAP